MLRPKQRVMVLGTVVTAAVGSALVLVGYRGRRGPSHEMAEPGSPGFPGFAAGRWAPGGSGSSTASPPPPLRPEEIAEQVTTAMSAWRNAIITKDPEMVVSLDRAFQDNPARFMEALVTSASTDDNERVRAFSTRILGKLRKPELAEELSRLLKDKSPYVRQNAAWALGELASESDGRVAAKRSVAELRHAQARDPAADVRSAARSALERLE